MKKKDLNPWDEMNRAKISKMALQKIERAKTTKEKEISAPLRPNRLPHGQELTSQFPVLDLGTQPNLSTSDWSLTCSGLIENPVTFDWGTFQSLERTKTRSDIHCVTNWSRYDNEWQGVSTQTLAKALSIQPAAKFVLLKSFDGYSTNMPLKDFLSPDALLADHWEGMPLSRKHGGPVRFVLPHLYFWKSAKWIKQIAFREDDHPGFWEVRGYHNYGDPWRNQRFKK